MSLLLSGLGACGKGEAPPPRPATLTVPPSSASGPVEAPTAPVTAASPAATVAAQGTTYTFESQQTLLAAGSDPKVALRFAPRAGASQTSLGTFTMDLEVQIGGREMRLTLPPMTVLTTTTIDEVRDDGDAVWTNRVVSTEVREAPDVSPEMIALARQAATSMSGLVATAIFDPRGRIKTVTLSHSAPGSGPGAVAFDAAQAWGLAYVEFPEEPVGAGARWQSRRRAIQRGEVDVATYELLANEGGTVKLRFSLQQSGQSPPNEEAARPTSMRVDALSGSGGGESTFDLGKVMPTALTGRMSTSLRMTERELDQETEGAMRMSVVLEIEEKK